MSFDAWAKSMDLDERQADRIAQVVEYEKGREQEIRMVAERLLSELGRMDYQDVLSARAEDRKTALTYWHSRGAAGEEIDAAELATLQKDNPTAYNAYMAGKAGKSLTDVQRDNEMQDKYVNAFITSFDPKSAVFQNALTTFFKELGVDVPEGLATSLDGGTSVYQAATNPAAQGYANIKGVDDPTYRQLLTSADTVKGYGDAEVVDLPGLGNKRWTYTNLEKALSSGGVVKENGKLYIVEGKSVEKKGGANWTVYTLKEIGTKETIQVSAAGSRSS
jgi:hypothetical protein